MPALVHNTFRVSNAKQFKESFEEKSEHGVGGYIRIEDMTPGLDGDLSVTSAPSVNNLNAIPYYALDDQMYLFIGRVSPWNPSDTPDGSIDPNLNENNPPFPVDSVKDSHFNHWDDMIAAKKVSDSEVSHVIKRERTIEIQSGLRNWTLGTRYDGYDDRSAFLFYDDMLIHTVNRRFRIYKCLKQGVGKFRKVENFNGVNGNTVYLWDHKSYQEPLNFVTDGGISEDYMVLGDDDNDGYQWKYYYTIDAGEALKFVTTSYIPVRRIRKENGTIENDFSDQYTIETTAIPGGILNVTVDKYAVETNDSTVEGYEMQGGDGYYQFGSSSAQVNYDDSQNSLTFQIVWNTVNNCDFPDPEAGTNAGLDLSSNTHYNMFSFANNLSHAGGTWTATPDAGLVAMGHKGLDTWLDYGVVIKSSTDSTLNGDAFKRYVFPISGVQLTSGSDFTDGTIEFTIDSTTIESLIGTSVTGVAGLPAATQIVNEDAVVEIHPRVKIEANHQSTTTTDPIDGFNAYGIVEPLFNTTTPGYHRERPGRVLDVRVTNPGKYHYRVDSAMVTGTANNYSTATVHAHIPPVGGHGFDAVEELGGHNVMINARFEGTESDEFTVGNEFRKIGILKNPRTYSSDQTRLWMNPSAYTELFRGYKTDQCYRINLTSASLGSLNGNTLNFEPDMDVGIYANSTGLLVATARIVDHDVFSKRIRVIKPRKDFGTLLASGDFKIKSLGYHSADAQNVEAFTVTTNTANTPGMLPGSGKILYVENRSMVSRSQNQTEDLKISIQF